jgi:hypothetical protein
LNAERKQSLWAIESAKSATPSQQTMLSLLEMAYGSAPPAHAALQQALEEAGRDEPPASALEIVAFVRACLVATLTEQVGPRVTVALLDELVKRLGGTPSQSFSVPPASVPRAIRPTSSASRSARPASAEVGVVLVDGDRVGRTHVARALVRGRCVVTVVDTVDELAMAIANGDSVEVALVDAMHPALGAIITALILARPDVAVVARSPDAGRTLTWLMNLGVSRLDVRPRETTIEDLVASVRRVARAE